MMCASLFNLVLEYASVDVTNLAKYVVEIIVVVVGISDSDERENDVEGRGLR